MILGSNIVDVTFEPFGWVDVHSAPNITNGIGGSGGTVTADDTPAAPAEGESATYFVTSAVSWPVGLVWSTDPDGDVAPTIVEAALVSMFTLDGVTRAVMGATFPAPVIPDTTPPSIPAGLSAVAASHTTVTLSWTASTDATGVTGYEYRVDGGTAVDAGAGVSEIVTGLTAVTEYDFEVRAYDAAGNRSGWSTVATETTDAAPDVTAPTVPTGLSATATGSTTVDLAWTASTDAVGVTGYEYRIDGGTAVDAGAGITETVSGLTGSTEYDFEVRAYDAAGNRSGWSTVATETTDAAASALAAAILALTPEGYWKLDETSGTTATDSSGNGHHGTYEGAVVLNDAKGSAKFVAGGTRVLIPDHANFTFWTGSESTVFVVFQKNTSTGASTLISKITASTLPEWTTEVSGTAGGELTVQRPGDGISIFGRGEAGGATSLGTWYAMACALPVNSGTSGVRGELYLNSGTAITSTFSTVASGPTGDSAAPVVIGARTDGARQALANICHVAVFRSRLTSGQVAGLMAAAASDGLI